MTDRVIRFTIGRIAADATDIDDGTLGDPIFGQVSNVNGGELEKVFNDGYGPTGRDRYWNGRFNLNDLTFTLLKASEQPSTLVGQDIFMELYVSWNDAVPELQTRITRYSGQLMNDGPLALDITTDSPRELTLIPYRKIEGGGTTQQVLSKAGSALYADTRTGELWVNGVDQLSALRTAHGIAPVA